MKDLRGLSLEGLTHLMESLNCPKFRAKQLYEWIHKKFIQNLQEAHNIDKATLQKLEEAGYYLGEVKCLVEKVSKDGTKKYLLALSDGATIECVLMHYEGDFSKNRYTLCISTQVGCAMGCVFCQTGKQGLQRNLTLDEILAQVYYVNSNLLEIGARVGNIVYMGMGEPLNNFEAVMESLSFLNDEKGANISMRRMTLSTCGIVPKIYALADLKLEVGLAISLHEVNDEARSRIMPVNNAYPLKELLKACHYYQEKTKKRISFEYALVSSLNVSEKKAIELSKLLKGLDCHLNLIPVNEVDPAFKKPSKNEIYSFLKALTSRGLKASIREEKGSDIEGACGQLRSLVIEN